MKFTTFIAENVRWNANKNPFGHLWAVTTDKDTLYTQLKAVDEKYYHERKPIGTIKTEFCLNYLALKTPTNFCQKQVLRHFDGYWQRFLRLKEIFGRGVHFPANGATRLEKIAELIAKCTAFCMDGEELKDILHDCKYLVNLTDREVEYLPLVVDLYRINYFCAVGYEVFDKNPLAQCALAKLLIDNKNGQFVHTTRYAQTCYTKDNLASTCDVLGNSLLAFCGENVDTSLKMLVYKCGRNVFDTFCKHQFYQNCAHFASDISNGKITQKYFLQDGCEVRKTTILHTGKNKSKFLVDLHLQSDGQPLTNVNGALCFATDKHYVAVAVVVQNKLAKCKTLGNNLTLEFSLCPNEQANFDVVTIVCESYQEIATKLAHLNYYGATRQREFCGQPLAVYYTTPLHPTPASNCFRAKLPTRSKQINFTYQLGSEDVATFLDNGGNSTTLLQGFVFGVGGEQVYAVDGGRFCQINCGKFTLDGKLTYQKQKSKCIVSHGEGKRVAICHATPQKTVFYLPFERASTVSFANNAFCVKDEVRSYTIYCCGQVDTFTTDGLEFSPYRLRQKLSKNLTAGNCLAICFAKDFQCSVTICSQESTPPIAPVVQESLVSTYLNYVNGKEVFCLNNFLKRPNALTLAGIVYTNPQFVKNYLQKLWQDMQQPSYYDQSGRLQKCNAEWLFDLACIYYATLTKDKDFPTGEMKNYVNTHLLSAKCNGCDLVVQALCLKKASQLDGFDKVKCLVHFASLTKEITQIEKLNKMAQAVGVLPLEKASKEHLKDLCSHCEIPKNWYYVSQLENLYGLHIVGASLRVCPTAFEEQLEEFALNFGGKRIYTTFTKGSVQVMTLNGTQCHQPFDPYSLKVDKNTLVVSY